MTITGNRPDALAHAEGMRSGGPAQDQPAVLIVGDNAPLFARSLAFALRVLGLDVRWQDDGPASAVRLAQRIRLDHIEVVVVDHVDLGSRSSLVAAAHDAGARVMVLVSEPDDQLQASSLTDGVDAVLATARPFDELAYDLYSGIARRSPPSPHRQAPSAASDKLSDVASSHDQLRSLSPREGDVLRWLMSGRTVDRIAEETGLSITTVRSHVRAILAKLGVSCQLAAVALAYGAGWSAKD